MPEWVQRSVRQRMEERGKAKIDELRRRVNAAKRAGSCRAGQGCGFKRGLIHSDSPGSMRTCTPGVRVVAALCGELGASGQEPRASASRALAGHGPLAVVWLSDWSVRGENTTAGPGARLIASGQRSRDAYRRSGWTGHRPIGGLPMEKH